MTGTHLVALQPQKISAQLNHVGASPGFFTSSAVPGTSIGLSFSCFGPKLARPARPAMQDNFLVGLSVYMGVVFKDTAVHFSEHPFSAGSVRGKRAARAQISVYDVLLCLAQG